MPRTAAERRRASITQAIAADPPKRDHPAAPSNQNRAAEAATGYIFGEMRLVPYVRQLREEARLSGDDRQEQLAERFLRRAGVAVE